MSLRELLLGGGGPRQSTGAGHAFGTWPVFLASISTILGAILFLRFGYAVAHTGLLGTLGIIVLGHLVTIPTALAVSEIATNRRVAGGGAYYIISRSFGTSIGGAIGVGLFLSQAISVAFYIVAFAEAFEPLYGWLYETYGVAADPRWLGVPTALLLAALVLTKGAGVGVIALRLVTAVLGLAILAFLVGEGPEDIRPQGINLTLSVEGADDFGTVFAVCFPAFTGMIAGLGLSGDLKRPQRSIPLGTIAATLTGMVVYSAVAIKLAQSATPDALAGDQFIMVRIATWGPSIYIGLAAAALSSAVGSLLVAPRTLQALAKDSVFPGHRLNRLFQQGWGPADEPLYATIISSTLALFFVLMGDIDFIAQILSMFFMVTYGALCSVSFLEYFAGNPSYRPTFRSRWYVSLLGAVMCGMTVLRMNAIYGFVAIAVMVGIYWGLRRTRQQERGLQAIFQGTMYQLTRRMQITLQRNRVGSRDSGWRPAIVALTRFGALRISQFDLLRWICHRHGFGQFVLFFEGEFSLSRQKHAREQVTGLVDRTAVSRAGVFVDSLICPSYGLAVAQTLQMPGISGLPNNCILLQCSRSSKEEIREASEAARLAVESHFNALILRSGTARFGYRSSIHLWVTEDSLPNAPMMIMLAYILVGHHDWRKASIRLFACFGPDGAENETSELARLIDKWRLPISGQNVTSVSCDPGEAMEAEVALRSSGCDLLVAGLTDEQLRDGRLESALDRYGTANDVLFVHASERIAID